MPFIDEIDCPEDKSGNSSHRERNPNRSEHPPPRPGDVVGEFQNDENDAEQAKKAYTSALG